MNRPLIRPLYLFYLYLFISMTSCFTLGRLSIEFQGTRTDWALLIVLIMALISALIGLISGELARASGDHPV